MKDKSLDPPCSEVILSTINLEISRVLVSCVSAGAQFTVSLMPTAEEDGRLHSAVDTAVESTQQPQYIVDEVERVIRECDAS